jgi:hypothetical protein
VFRVGDRVVVVEEGIWFETEILDIRRALVSDTMEFLVEFGALPAPSLTAGLYLPTGRRWVTREDILYWFPNANKLTAKIKCTCGVGILSEYDSLDLHSNWCDLYNKEKKVQY